MAENLHYKTVTTRKPHICFGCGRKFEPPCKMVSAAFLDGGTVSNYYLCQTCEEIVSKMEWYDEYGFGDLREEAFELERECRNNDRQRDFEQT